MTTMKATPKRKGGKAPARKPAKDYARMAGFVLDILNASATPQIVKDAIDDALVEAQNQTQIEILIPGGYDPSQLAELFRSADKHGLRIHSGYFSTNAARRRTGTGTDEPRPQPQPLPAIDYEPFIRAHEADIAARTSVADLAPEFRTEEHKAVLVAQRLAGWRERFTEYAALGEFYAAALESADTTAAAHNALNDELMGLADEANLSITSPVVLRLLYPLMRHYAREFERAGRQAATK
jgi:hypothetical protein